MTYISGLDWLRFLMCVFIAIYDFSTNTDHNSYFLHLVASSGYYATSTFFILSGFILTFVYKNQIVSKQLKGLDFIVKRLSNIYPLHIILQVCFLTLLILSLLVLGITPSSYVNLSSSEIFSYFIRSGFLIHAWDDTLILNQPSWSLSTLFFFYIIFIFSRRLILSKRYVTLFLIFWSLYLTPAIINFYFPDGVISYDLLHRNPLFRLPEFLCGIVAYNVFEAYSDRIKQSYILLGILGAIITAFVVLANPEYQVLFHNGLVLPFQILLILGCAKFTRLGWNSKLFGSLALPIFMTHSLVLNISQFVLPDFNIHLFLICNTLLIILVSYLSLKFISAPLQIKIRKHLIN